MSKIRLTRNSDLARLSTENIVNEVCGNEADMSVTSAKWLTTPEQVFFVVEKLATIRALKPWLTVQQHVVLEKI
jgi:hypothetical protein